MGNARFIVADVFDGLASLEPGSVDLICTSPPFLAQRSYLPADHPDKAKEIGSEATPGAFLDTMLDVVEACARVLAPHGSLVVELGDTYAGSGGAGGDYAEGGLREGAPGFDGSAKWKREAGRNQWEADHPIPGNRPNSIATKGVGWPLDKSKTMIPQLFAIALAYGVNPLTQRQTEPWRVRNVVAWCRPNPPVGRDGDKFRPATSFLTVACKGRDRYWDGDAVRTEPGESRGYRVVGEKAADSHLTPRERGETRPYAHPAGAPLLDWWSIPTHSYAGSHYATYPPALVVPIIKAMCPLKVCRVCGKPSTRITRTEYGPSPSNGQPGVLAMRENERMAPGVNQWKAQGNQSVSAYNETLGWSDCGHDDWRLGIVCDPFAGSGTTLSVATGLGRDAVGIDLDARNADLAYERCGMFLTVETLAEEGVA